MAQHIGLLGGSFNPAHEGHVYISQKALEILKLDEIWWLVSPQNPLKAEEGMASFNDRLHNCLALTDGRTGIKPSDFEQRHGLRYTCDTLKHLTEHYRDKKFVWLMGADNLLQFHQWKNWKKIMNSVPIGVFNRNTGSEDALKSKAALAFNHAQISLDSAAKLVTLSPPCWCFIDMPLHPASSTKIREGL